MHDFERGAKVTGSKFYFTIGEDAELEWQMLTDMKDYWTAQGYTFIIPPYLVNKKTAEQAGILPRFQGDFYETKEEEFLLIPTAETPLVGLHSDEIFSEKDLPVKYVAFSPCFRREAGTHGQRDKGLKRVHQFHKIELFVICKPEDSYKLHTEMVSAIKQMLLRLYPTVKVRTVALSETDRSPVSAHTVDIEAKYGDEWLEISSISNTEDRQSKIALIRYKPENGGKPVKCHMLNGSGVALPRLKLALTKEKE